VLNPSPFSIPSGQKVVAGTDYGYYCQSGYAIYDSKNYTGYICVTPGAGQTGAACLDSSQCDVNKVCNLLTFQCIDKYSGAIGTNCTENAMCISGRCASGVCIDLEGTPCSGTSSYENYICSCSGNSRVYAKAKNPDYFTSPTTKCEAEAKKQYSSCTGQEYYYIKTLSTSAILPVLVNDSISTQCKAGIANYLCCYNQLIYLISYTSFLGSGLNPSTFATYLPYSVYQFTTPGYNIYVDCVSKSLKVEKFEPQNCCNGNLYDGSCKYGSRLYFTYPAVSGNSASMISCCLLFIFVFIFAF
jgi:hypothetical protein